MEAVVVLVIIAVLMLILGVSLTSVAAGIMVLLIVALGGMLILFAVCGIFLAMSRREDAVLDGFEKPHGYDTAVYRVGEERITNLFPAEGIFRGLIYKQTECRVFVCRLKKRSFAIDRHSATIIIAGIALTLPSLIAVVAEFVTMF
ncbi:MAG: hypothetical protein IJ723_01340 [Ruminococcus sp.]|nr:hypothetical protein [Ruminococcus sp.]